MDLMNLLTFGGQEKEESLKKNLEALICQLQERQKQLSDYWELRKILEQQKDFEPTKEMSEIDAFVNATFSVQNKDGNNTLAAMGGRCWWGGGYSRYI